MKLWKLSQTQNNSYDTYDSCVVAASTEEIARATHPSDYDANGWARKYKTWANTPADVTVEYIGYTDRKYAEGTVIVASFNAG